ncbi:MAG TPA: hypothetical protein VH763_02575 [Gemmatimonadales bacterium]
MSADSSAVPQTPAPRPLSSGAAVAILGSMLFLIVALTFLLARATWVNPASASAPPAQHRSIAHR